MRKTLPVLIGLTLCLPSARAADDWYAKLSLDEALKKAKADNKLVFIDFFASWCGPCKMMDATTFKDPKVLEWLGKHTVALKVEGDKDTVLSTRFAIDSFPTLVFLKPDGTEIDRLLGYMTAEQLLTEGAGILTGKTAIERAKEDLAKGDPNDPVLHLKLASAYASKGKADEAVKEYLWCLDTGFDKHPEMSALRGEAVMGLLSLIQSNPKIIEEIEKRRGQAREKLSEGKATPNDVGNLAILNEAGGQPEETLKLYDKLRADEKTPPAVRKALAQGVMGQLLDAKRYADIAADIDIAAAVDEQFAAAAKAPSGDEQARYMLVGVVATYYQVLIGVKRDEDAAKVAKRLVQTIDMPETYNALAWNGFASGRPAQANLDQARKANELTGGKNASIIDTLARVLHALGKKEEAVKTVEEALKTVAEPSDREALQACLTDVKK